ncbi:MAG: hypothetical protein IJJ74_00330 [Eubacterium sp.]|nr:hypothetical protein [Eubacterium sp.]
MNEINNEKTVNDLTVKGLREEAAEDSAVSEGYGFSDNRGAVSIELILVLVVLVALVVIFKSQIVSLANTIWKNINSGASTIFS